MKIIIPLWVLCSCLLVAGDPRPGDFEYFDLGFSDGQGYQTEIRAFNPSFSESVLITVEAKTGWGTPLHGVFPQNSAAFSLTLPPLASVSMPTMDNMPVPVHGTMQLNSDGPVVAWSRTTFGDPDRPEKSDTQVFRPADAAPSVAHFNDLSDASAPQRFPTRVPGLMLPLHEVLVVRNTEAFTSTVAVHGRDALLGHGLPSTQVEVAPYGSVSLTASQMFPSLASGRASLEVHELQGRVFTAVRREDSRTLARAKPAVDESGVLPFANLPFEGFEGYFSFKPLFEVQAAVTGELSLTEPVNSVPFNLNIDQPGITRFLPGRSVLNEDEVMGTARFTADEPVTGSFTLFGDGARSEIALSDFEGPRAVAYLGKNRHVLSSARDLLFIENPGETEERLSIIGLNRDGALRDLITGSLVPGQNVWELTGVFGEDTELVLIEKIDSLNPLKMAYVITDQEPGRNVLDSIEVLEIDGVWSFNRFLEEVAAWETRDAVCISSANRLLGLVDMVNHNFTCPNNR
ncbi:hypothetical protein [Acanthopleuribacter pedis]|uniref:Phytase-like domain-containing protein n=1 Tax=Acanthopleuribacter pedis TaxID=442870 RepID=A0A8J7Q3L4_9BACT|nr:hypothetical protein [Acanthopleuribacter pedis]MBO1317338.1 hypothetical protein [Acanthopleuribacter pedis]MBO1318645.1 hypothetical protein [Acanthopleuribacter pedis]